MERPPHQEKTLPQGFLTPPNSSHPGDYALNLEGYGINDAEHVPQSIADALQEKLGDEWRIGNRGTRLEISHVSEFGKRDDLLVMNAVEQILSQNGYRIEV